MTSSVLIPLSFAAAYALFVVFPRRRSAAACAAAALLVAVGALSWREAVLDHVQWNVIGLFFGTLVLAELFMMSRMPAVIAERIADRTRTVRGAMLAICLLSGLISIFVENVAVVLLVAPVAFSLAERLRISPARIIILIAVSSNLQGTATLIGDPPSMILAGYLKMSFNDFFVYHGRPGIFFAVQIGAAAALAVTAWLLRGHREQARWIPVETVRAWTPTVLMLALVLGLASTSTFDPDFRWLAGTMTLALACAGLIWYRMSARWGSARELIRTLDWDTTFFLIGVFVLVGALSESGWLDRLAALVAAWSAGSLLRAFLLLLAVAVLVSGFVDNVPFLLAMIPVAQKAADQLGAPVPLFLFALLIGSCLGGNLTPIGASANIVAVGLLRKKGYPVSFGQFLLVGVPFTAAAVVAAAAFVWAIWAP